MSLSFGSYGYALWCKTILSMQSLNSLIRGLKFGFYKNHRYVELVFRSESFKGIFTKNYLIILELREFIPRQV